MAEFPLVSWRIEFHSGFPAHDPLPILHTLSSRLRSIRRISGSTPTDAGSFSTTNVSSFIPDRIRTFSNRARGFVGITRVKRHADHLIHRHRHFLSRLVHQNLRRPHFHRDLVSAVRQAGRPGRSDGEVVQNDPLHPVVDQRSVGDRRNGVEVCRAGRGSWRCRSVRIPPSSATASADSRASPPRRSRSELMTRRPLE